MFNFPPQLVYPKYICELQNFGIGAFFQQQIEEKISTIQKQRPSMQCDNPVVSVVIPAFKEETFLLATLLSLANQQFKKFECIVVNNGEAYPNPTTEIAEACQVKVIHLKRKGIAYARQAGLEAANARIVSTTDADTLHHPLWLRNICHRFLMNPGIIGLTGEHVYLTNHTSQKLYRYFTQLRRRVISPSAVSGMRGANSSFIREATLQAGGYNTELHCGEDSDLTYKLKKVGKVLRDHHPFACVFVSNRRNEQQKIVQLLSRDMKNKYQSMTRDSHLPDAVHQEYKDHRDL